MELASAFQIAVDFSVADRYLNETLEVAQNYLEMGVLNEAEEHFERILSFKGDCLAALEGLIRIYEQTARADAWQRTRLRLARALVARNEYEPAAELLRQLTQSNPRDTETRLFHIQCLTALGQSEAAAGEYIRVAEELAGQGEIERALEIYRAAEALDPLQLDVSPAIIELLVNAGRREEALVEHIKVSERRRQAGDSEGSVAALEAALELDATREDLCVRLAERIGEAQLAGEPLTRLCEQIRALLAARLYGPAAQTLDTLERAFAERPALIGLRAELEEGRGNAEGALGLRLQSIDLHQQRREYEAALAILDKTMSAHGDNVALLSRKANLLREMGRCTSRSSSCSGRPTNSSMPRRFTRR
jgi:tetratricopeptide (TPR) repeat protein